MNNDLNIQLIEQLISADAELLSSLDGISQHIHNTLASQLKSYSTTTLYRARGTQYVEIAQYPSADDTRGTVAIEIDAVKEALHNNQTIVDNDNVYVPVHNWGVPFGALRLGVQDKAEQTQLNWTLLHNLLNTHIQNVIHQQINAHKETILKQVEEAQSFADITHALVNGLELTNQFVSLSLTQFDGDKVTLGNVVASANRNQSFEGDITLGATEADHMQLYHDLLENGIAYVRFDGDKPYSDTLKQWLEKHGITSVVFVGVWVGEKMLAHISIQDTKYDLTLSPQAENLWRTAASTVGHIIALKNMIQASDQAYRLGTVQAKVLNEISIDKSFEEIALNIAQHMLPQKGRYITLNKVLYDENDNAIEWNMIASANRNKIYTDLATNLFPWQNLKETTKQRILNGESYTVTKDFVNDDEKVSGEVREILEGNNIHSMQNYPIKAGDKVFGLMTIVNRMPLNFMRDEHKVFQSISSQIGTIIELRDRLQQTKGVQHTLASMVNTIYEISLAESDSEIVDLLFWNIPDSISELALYRFTTPANVDTPPLSINLRVIADRNNVLASDQTILLTDATQFSPDIIQRLLDGKFITETDLSKPTGNLPTVFYQSLQTGNIQSCIITGLRVSQQLIGLLVLGSDSALSIASDYYRNFRILGDQIGITYENQRLLRRTEVTLMETQLQYAISNDLVTSKSLTDMTKVLLRYFGENADGAGIVEVQYDNQEIVSDALIRYQIKPNDATVYEPNTSILEYVNLDDMHALQTAWSMNDAPIYFIEDDEDENPELPLKIFVQQGIASLILIPLFEDRMMTHVISLNWSSSQTFSERTRRLLNAMRRQLDIIYQNQQLLKQAQVTSSRLAGQVQTQRALNDLATFTGTNQDEKLLLDKGAETLKTILNVDHVGIMLIEEDRKTAYLASETPIRTTEPIRIPFEGDVWSRLKRGEYHIVQNIADPELLTKESQYAVNAVGASATLFLPIVDVSGHLIGSVGLDKLGGKLELSDDQIQTARLINAQIVTQLQNLRLLSDSQQLADQMQQIARYGETVQSRLDLDEILQTTLHFAKRITEAGYISITLYNPQLEKLVVQAYYLDGYEVIQPPDNPIMGTESTVAGQVWQTRESVYVPNLNESDYNNPISDKVVSVYSNAIISRGVTRGVFEVGYTTNRAIRLLEQSVFSQLSNQLSVALENAMTYSQSQRLAQNKILANEISLQLQQQMDIDSLLNTTVTELGKALGAKRARIRLGIQQAVKDQ